MAITRYISHLHSFKLSSASPNIHNSTVYRQVTLLLSHFFHCFTISQEHTEKISCSVPLVISLRLLSSFFAYPRHKVKWTELCGASPSSFPSTFHPWAHFLRTGTKFLPKAVPTPSLSAAVIRRRLPHVPQWASSTLQVQLFLPRTYWEWHQIASFNLASYRCYQAGMLTVFKPVSARVTEHVSILSAHYGLFFFFLIANVHILIPAKWAELLNTLAGTASGWKGRMFVNGWDKTAGRGFHRRGNSELIPGSGAWQCLWMPSYLTMKSNWLLDVTIYAVSELYYLLYVLNIFPNLRTSQEDGGQTGNGKEQL